MAIAIAALLGGALQVLVQWPALWREGFRYRLVLDPRDPGLRQVLVLMGPGTIGLAATQVNLFVNTLLATSQGTGAVSWLSYAFRLMYLPIGLFGVSIATAALPAVSRYAAVGDEAGIRRTVGRSHRDDDGAQRPGDARSRHAGGSDRSAAVRARTLHAVRHRIDGGGLAALRRRARRVTRPRESCRRCSTPSGRAACRSSVSLCTIAHQHRRQPLARARHGLQGPRARHVAGDARQRHRAVCCCCGVGCRASKSASWRSRSARSWSRRW